MVYAVVGLIIVGVVGFYMMHKHVATSVASLRSDVLDATDAVKKSVTALHTKFASLKAAV